MLMALLLPDPCDVHCPGAFKEAAREILLNMRGRRQGWDKSLRTDEGIRKVILEFIGDFSNWDNSADPVYLDVSRSLIKAAHPDETPLVVDPFAGGGSIPLEALRLGCEAFASDLNPVACLIQKVMLEDIPRYGLGLAEELRHAGAEIKQQMVKELAEFYPRNPILPDELKKGSFVLFRKQDDGFRYVVVGNVEEHLRQSQEEYTHYAPAPKGAEHGPNFSFATKDWHTLERQGVRPLELSWEKPIAYIWSRTIKCESPNCGAEMPLARSFWLCKKSVRNRALGYNIVRPKGKPPRVEFEVIDPKSENEVPRGTVTRAKATCLCCNTVLSPERVRAQLAEQSGGAEAVFDDVGNRIGGARILAVVTLNPNVAGRHYRLPDERDYKAIWKAQRRLKSILDDWEKKGKKDLCPVPDEPLPPIGTLGFRVQRYGVLQWGDFFSARQKLALFTLAELIGSANTISRPLSLALGKLADLSNVICPWEPIAECPRNVLSNGRVKPSWDYAEGVTTSESSGSFAVCLENLISGILSVRGIEGIGSIELAAAQQSPLPDESVRVWFTDPPYYDAIPYAALSDMFFVWFKRCLKKDASLRDPYDEFNPLTPKVQEAVQDGVLEFQGKKRDKAFFEDTMALAFSEGRRIVHENCIGCIVFAHKTTEGWEALISGIIRGGWVVTGSWPIATEQAHRLRARDSAALATSVHLICRPRSENAPVGDWGEILRELPRRVGDWMEHLQSESIRGADLVFACIGPALEVFSRYATVETADGREVQLAVYLEKVWEVVGRTALEQVLGTAEARARNGMTGVLEEDARLTALFLWTLQSTNNQNGASTESDEEANEDSEDEEDGDSTAKGKAKGYSLVFDVVRRFAQPLGIELPKWEGRVIETKKGVVRLMAISERAKQLFGEAGAAAAADLIEDDPSRNLQQVLFPEMEANRVPRIRGRGRHRVTIDPSAVGGEAMREATTLDRVHAAMLLQAGGQANALRALIKAEQDRGSDFLRLANALSALYPTGSEEKRLLDAMLLAVPR